jgi:micrococcal nuclease
VSEDCDIKGNVSQNTGEKIYHMPDQQFYDVTNAEEMFCTEEEAQDAGYRKSLR